MSRDKHATTEIMAKRRGIGTAIGRAALDRKVPEHGIVVNLITVHGALVYKPHSTGVQGQYQPTGCEEGIVPECIAIFRWRPRLRGADNEHPARTLKNEVINVLHQS